MGVGFYLTGTFDSDEYGQTAADWLEQVASWIESHEEEPLMLCHCEPDDAEVPTLFVHVHPCAEELEFRVPEPNVCVVTAKTSTVGPGYHIFLCELVAAFGRHFHVAWDEPDEEGETGDETGYFHNGDPAAVRMEMLRWLSALSRVVVENCAESALGVRMVSMPLDYSYPEQTGVLTPIGPRPPEWFEQLVEAPEQGVDFFAWWPEGVGAAFFLGRALCRLWQDVRWRLPLTEEEGELLLDVHFDLERAYHLDPQSGLPWREWRDLLNYLSDYFGYCEFQHEEALEAEILRQADAIAPEQPLIGYRRGKVQALLTGGWSLIIPGDFVEKWEENGETWRAWNTGRTVQFTSWSVKGENDASIGPREILSNRLWPEDGEMFEHDNGALVGRAVFLPCEEDNRPMWNLKGYSAVEDNLALCNIFIHNRADLPWALEVWKSMRN